VRHLVNEKRDKTHGEAPTEAEDDHPDNHSC
jgi:hypothetical protein